MPPIFNEAIDAMNKNRIAMARLWDDVGVAEEKQVGDAQLVLATIMQSEGPNFKFEAGQREPFEFIKWVFGKANMTEDEIPNPLDVDKSSTLARALMQLTAQKYQEVYLQASMMAQMEFITFRKKEEEDKAMKKLAKGPDLKLVDTEGESEEAPEK